MALEKKINIVYGIDCSVCEAVCFGEFKRSLKILLKGREKIYSKL